MNRKTEPYRNAHGVELKPGNWFMGADEYGHKEGIIDRVVKSGLVVELNGGVSVVYRSAPGEHAVQSILADNVMQTLGPMIIERDGTVKQNPIKHDANFWREECNYIAAVTDKKGRVPAMNNSTAVFRRYCEMQRNTAEREGFFDTATYIQECIDDLPATRERNPLTRVKVKSPAQRGGAAPDARLTKRRKVTQKAPPGFYANPTPRLQSPTQKSQRDHWDAKRERYTDKASIRLQTRRAKTHNLGMPGVWANPLSDSDSSLGHPPHHYGDPSGREWFLIETKAPKEKRFRRHATFAHKSEAAMYARALHGAHPTWAIRLSDES